MTIRTICVLMVATAAGCGPAEPPQPKLTDAQIQEQMAKAKKANQEERGTRGGGGQAPKS